MMAPLFALLIGLTLSFSFDAYAQRIVGIGGANSEIICSLGYCEQLVAVDTSSTFPKSLDNVKKIGYARSLSLEGILAQKPELIILDEEAGPPHVLSQLEKTKVRLVKVKAKDGVDGAKTRIRMIAEGLGAVEKGELLIKDLEANLAKLTKFPPDHLKKRVLFVYARGGKHLMVAGNKTPVSTLLELSRAQNAIDGFEGFKPLTAEAVTLAKPDLILMTKTGAESLGGKSGVFELPGMKLTPAAKNQKLYLDDDLSLLTIGPRTHEVAEKIHAMLSEKS